MCRVFRGVFAYHNNCVCVSLSLSLSPSLFLSFYLFTFSLSLLFYVYYYLSGYSKYFELIMVDITLQAYVSVCFDSNYGRYCTNTVYV